MINSSFTEGSFLNILKIAQVCTVFKKGECDLRENYRPISLLSNLSKLFERAMHSRVYSFLENSGLFFDLQFGFRNKHSQALLFFLFFFSLKRLGLTGEFYQKAGPNTGPEA